MGRYGGFTTGFFLCSFLFLETVGLGMDSCQHGMALSGDIMEQALALGILIPRGILELAATAAALLAGLHFY